MCAGCQSAPCVSSHMALSSGSLAANSSNGENLAAVSQRISRWAALQGWTGGRMMEKERQRDRDKVLTGNKL